MSTSVILFVSPTKNSIKLCRYVYDHIDQLHSMGVVIKVERLPVEVDDSLAKKLKKARITHLPAAVIGEKVFIGVDKICEIFNKNIRKMQDADVPKPDEFGSNPDLAEFWRNEISMKDPRDPGNQEDPEADRRDMQKQLAKAEAMRKPMNHRVGSVPREQEEEMPRRESVNKPIDNMGGFKYNTGESGDDQMLNAFADKIGISSF